MTLQHGDGIVRAMRRLTIACDWASLAEASLTADRGWKVAIVTAIVTPVKDLLFRQLTEHGIR